MAREKTSMELQDIIIRLKKGHSIKRIHRDTGIHREVIRKLLKISKSKGWLNNGQDLPSEKDVLKAYYGVRNGKSHTLDQYYDELAEYAEKDISYVVMHQIIGERAGVSETTVRRYVKTRIKTGIVKETVERSREKSVMEVDFGRLGIVYDALERRTRTAYIFSGRLRYSGKAYREVVYDQKQETFFECHMHAFEYFGRVPEKVVPDNLKAAVIKASFTDPIINRAYRDLAAHYGFLIDPCLPYTPEHKGGVESDIKYVKRNFLAEFRIKQEMMGRDIPLSGDILPALREWEKRIADVRIIKAIGRTPDDLFAEESAYLNPLPPERFDIVVWCKAIVRRNGRVNFDRSTYSVPDRYIGKEVFIASNSRKIRVFYDYELIAEHNRSQKPYRDVVNPDHLGRRALAYIEYSRENLLLRAGGIGNSAHELCRILLDDRVVARERSVHGIISLAHKYGFDRVEAACSRALAFDVPRYDTVKRILKNNLDGLSLNHPADSHGQTLFAFARNSGYFNI